MAKVIEEPIDMWRGTAPTIFLTVDIDGGGTDRVFYLRLGHLNGKASLEKTMTEILSTAESVDLSASLSAVETAGVVPVLIDFQVISSNPLDVVLEGKFRMRPIIKART